MIPLRLTTPSDTQVRTERGFKAPRSLVWRAFSEPELVKQWLTGPEGHTMPGCEIDFREGGSWRYTWLTPIDPMVAFGTFKTITPETLIVHTETFELFPNGTSIVETEFFEAGDETIVIMTINCNDKATRDAIVMSGMDQGLEASYRNLDRLVLEDQHA
ncbi:MAG: SRPBCC domain-containing protein [Rhodothermales bacterium]